MDEERMDAAPVDAGAAAPADDAAPEAHELTKLEKLEAKMAHMKRLIAIERKKESDKKRRERTHRLIRHGGLIEMILGESVDAGTLAGLLDMKKAVFLSGSGEALEWKRRGNRIIAEREAEREMERLKRKGGGDAHAAGASSNG